MFIFLLLPIIVARIESHASLDVDLSKIVEDGGTQTCAIEPIRHYGWIASIGWFVLNFAKNLLFVVRVSVPWMLFSGLLGATIITVVPWSEFTAWLSSLNQWQQFLGLLITSFFGLLLPAPIAFDVIFPSNLLDQGLSPMFVGSLLFSLGIFSIYPFIIIGRYISWNLAGTLTITLVLLSVCMGMLAGYLGKIDAIRSQALFNEVKASMASPNPDREAPIHNSETIQLTEVVRVAAPDYRIWEGFTPEGIKIERSGYETKSASESDFLFQAKNADEIGFSTTSPGNTDAGYQFFLPTSYSRGLASGDLQNDGWVDVVRATENGLEIYLNDGKGKFVQVRPTISSIQGMQVLSVALVDIDNDGYKGPSIFNDQKWKLHSI